LSGFPRTPRPEPAACRHTGSCNRRTQSPGR